LFQCDADQRESVTCHCLGRTKMYKHARAPTQGNGTPDQSHVRSIVRTICMLTPSLDSRLEHKLHLRNLRVPHSLSPVDVHLGKYMARTNRTLFHTLPPPSAFVPSRIHASQWALTFVSLCHRVSHPTCFSSRLFPSHSGRTIHRSTHGPFSHLTAPSTQVTRGITAGGGPSSRNTCATVRGCVTKVC
jgi:hypothetical protein